MIRDFVAIDFETANQQPPAAMTSNDITTHWPMQKPVQR
jgi:hypothetical protein